MLNAADAVMPSQVAQFSNAGAVKALCDLLMDSNIIPSPVAPLQALVLHLGRGSATPFSFRRSEGEVGERVAG